MSDHNSNRTEKLKIGIGLAALGLAAVMFYHRWEHLKLGIDYEQGELISSEGYLRFCNEAIADERKEFIELVERMNYPDYESQEGEIEKILEYRDSSLKSAGCRPGCESWLYFWNDENGKWDVQFRNEHTCGDYPNRLELQMQGFDLYDQDNKNKR